MIRADANPATKLLMFGRNEGKYKNPEPAECSGITKISYFPGGRPPDLGAPPWPPCGGGGGGWSFMTGAQAVGVEVRAVDDAVVDVTQTIGASVKP